ncbi:replication-relaxation family protein [Caldalkalibacillus thermarum]|uniref:replication-relaxation family protein n=1 Tax=Caldalkalibacillus thermarum TaxID=296745 RepID=UPI001666BF2F|nr:replication-relaxation family protein [Caldalkalibacillus thermarum]
MQVIKQVTERDLGILRDLYRFRVMNGEQIRRLYFGEHEAYTYRKLYIMRNSGWIRSRKIARHLSDASRIEAVHYITDRGLRVLREHQLIGDEEIEAKDLHIKKENMDSYLDFVDLYVELKDSGYTFVDSRELKKKYRTNRGDLYKGSIIDRDGNEYFVYIIKGGARESTLRRVLFEAEKNTMEVPLCRNLILFRGVKSYDEFLGMMDSHVLASACLMPFGFACQYLRHYQGSQHLVNLITKHGEARENHDHLKSVYPYIIRCGESEKYVADLMMNDLALLDRMKRERHDKEVMVFTHELFSYDIEERLKDMRGIEVIEITDKELGIC